MKTLITTGLLTASIFTATAINPNAPSSKASIKSGEGKVEQANSWLEQAAGQLGFTENKGQIRDQHWKYRPDVLFSGSVGGMVFHIRKNGISYQLFERERVKDEGTKGKEKTGSSVPDQMHDLFHEREKPQPLSIYRTDIYWEGINENYTIVTDQVKPGYNNYYNVPEGNEPALFVKDYQGMWLKDIYAGIDLHYYSDKRGLKYDYIVQPGADYRQIKMRIEGADVEITKEGSLLLSTPFGTIEEGRPIAFQEGKEVKAEWVITGNILSVAVEGHNPDKPLIIDPPVRLWGTYYGGSGDDWAYSCTVDDINNVFLAGYTASTINIATTGAHQITNGGGDDAFLIKFNGSGQREWSTYYGGSGQDWGWFCAVDINGNILLTGETTSTINIATTGAHQEVYEGDTDAFLVKFNASGVRQWGTYYGGSEKDIGRSCATDENGNVFLTGETGSSSNIATIGAHQATSGWEDWYAYLVKFNESGVRQWGTYYGGNYNSYGNSCAVDDSNNVFLAGHTTSTINIATTGAHQESQGWGTDAFLVKFNGSGVRLWGTYYGGSSYEQGYSCAVDGSGNVFLAGQTNSSTNIATTGAHQESYVGNSHAFLAKFNGSGVRQWGTYYGDFNYDYGYFCAVDGNGNVFLTGRTSSVTNMTTTGAHQETFAGANDAFLVKFNGSGVRKWGTYYGGSGGDSGWSCAVDGSENVFLAGYTFSSSNNIATTGAHQETHGGQRDAFLVKFHYCNTFSAITTTACDNYTSPSGNYTWTSSGNYTDTIPNSAGCDSIIAIDLTINNVDTSVTSNPPTLTAIADPATTYQWIDCNNNFAPLSGEDGQNFTATVNGSYAVIVTQNGCTDTSYCYAINNVGLDENSWEGALQVFPNPAQNEFTIDLGQYYAKVHIRITDVKGKEVFVQSGLAGQTHTLNLDQSAGVYFIHVQSEGEKAVLRLVKQ